MSMAAEERHKLSGGGILENIHNMKNEDKIVELLAEGLKKQDQHAEILTRLAEGQKTLADGQRELIDQFHKMNDHLLTRQEKIEDRVTRLEDKVFKN